MARKGTDVQIRRKAVDRYIAGENIDVLAAEHGVSKITVYRWVREVKAERLAVEKDDKNQPVTRKMYNQLKEHTQKLEGIIEILKSVNCTASDPLDVKLAELERLYYEEKYSVHMMCDALDVSRGTFYNHIKRNKRDKTVYAKRKEELRELILQIFDDSNQIYGAPKILAELKDMGQRTTLQTVRLLMREMGLVSVRYGAKKQHMDETRKCRNLVKQNFDVQAPNKVWVSDVTYYRFKGESYCICAVMDLFARRIVGCKVGYNNNTSLVKAAFKAAYEARKPGDGLIFHTDRGSNYCSRTFRRYLKKRGAIQSFNKAGYPYDNSVVESFFASMKRENLYRTRYRSESEFRAGVDYYINYYNIKLRHETLNYISPQKYEERYATATTENGVA